jgi:hypothetical protein
MDMDERASAGQLQRQCDVKWGLATCVREACPSKKKKRWYENGRYAFILETRWTANLAKKWLPYYTAISRSSATCLGTLFIGGEQSPQAECPRGKVRRTRVVFGGGSSEQVAALPGSSTVLKDEPFAR